MSSPPSQPNLTGTWRANLEKSVLRTPLQGELVHLIAHSEPSLEQEMILTHDGREQRLTFRYLTTGEETINHLAGCPAKNRAHWEGADLVIESWTGTARRELHFEGRWALSEDRNTLTMSHHGDPLAGQIVVHDRVTIAC